MLKPALGRRRANSFAVVLALGVGSLWGIGAACVGSPAPPPPWSHPEVRLVWPAEPERPRIEYLGAIRSAADLGGKIGLWKRFTNVLFGKERTAMLKPISAAKNAAGVLVVADPGVPTVHRFDLERREYQRLGDEPIGLLRSPVGVAIDDEGHVYVADSVRSRVFVFDADRRLIAELGEKDLVRPTGLALGPAQEHLYVVDTTACRVAVFDTAGRQVRSFGRRGVGPGELNAPTFITVAPDGTISVSDSLNFRIQSFGPDGTPIDSFGRPGDGTGHFTRPKGVAADAAGRLFVVDAAFENVQIFDPKGSLLLPFGGPGTGPGEFTLPGGIFVDSTNTVWVADSFNQRIQVFRLMAE